MGCHGLVSDIQITAQGYSGLQYREESLEHPHTPSELPQPAEAPEGKNYPRRDHVLALSLARAPGDDPAHALHPGSRHAVVPRARDPARLVAVLHARGHVRELTWLYLHKFSLEFH